MFQAKFWNFADRISANLSEGQMPQRAPPKNVSFTSVGGLLYLHGPFASLWSFRHIGSFITTTTFHLCGSPVMGGFGVGLHRLWVFAKFIADTPYILTWKWFTINTAELRNGPKFTIFTRDRLRSILEWLSTMAAGCSSRLVDCHTKATNKLAYMKSREVKINSSLNVSKI